MNTDTRGRGKTGWIVGIVAVVAIGALVAVFAFTGSDESDPGANDTTPAAERDSARSAAMDGHEWLWPFADEAEALEWQRGYREGGHSPWHVDAEATALSFTTGYLGFTGIDQVVDSSIDGDTAEVTVGYVGDGDSASPAATLLLVRLGSGDDAPWEVVGSAESDSMALTEPAPGTAASSPMRVAGLITGVDESIHVQVRDPAQPAPVGDECCLPAGGEDTPWSTTVTFGGTPTSTLTVVASTGGHVADVERFAVTGVRPAT
jgi:hypothetical protein